MSKSLAALLFLSVIAPILAQLVPTGTLGGIGSAGSAANLYIATDQGICSPIYYKQSDGSWAQLFSVGNSGALACVGTTIDINSATVPMLATTNAFTGLNTFSQFRLAPATMPRPTCDQTQRGLFRFENNGRAKDSVLVCVSSGNGMKWAQLSLIF